MSGSKSSSSAAGSAVAFGKESDNTDILDQEEINLDKLINEIIYSTQIKKEKLLNPDIISFPFFYDITIQNPELYITSYNTFTSKIYPLKIILDQNLELKLTFALFKQLFTRINRGHFILC